MPVLTPIEWFLVLLASFVLGLGKSGIKGFGVLIVLMMAFVFEAKPSTGIIMPLLLVGDLFAIFYYRKHVMWKHLKRLLPGVVLGVLVGVWVGNTLDERLFAKLMAFIILIGLGVMLWWNNKSPKIQIFGPSMGLFVGFTSMIGNLAGPFSNIYLLVMKLPKNNFIGTAAWLYFVVNWFKVPFHVFIWETITTESLKISLFLIPAVLAGLLAGVYLVKGINDQNYRRFILIMTALGAAILFFR